MWCACRASGAVYSATDSRNGKLVAIKQMVMAKQIKREILVNEIRIMSESRHPAIVQYIDRYPFTSHPPPPPPPPPRACVS
jgi:p21-activated kinase 1